MSYEDHLESKNLKLYLDQISKYPIFSGEEEKSLGLLIQQGDADSRNPRRVG